jgi:eukaryotic-like serine/threonine-protein kinase
MTAPAQSLKEIFLAALEVAPELRAQWLLQVCGNDTALQQQLALMLQAHEAPQSLLDQSTGALGLAALGMTGVTATNDVSLRPGTAVGPYKILQQIGEGGMGTVYMAEQTQPVRRTVAIKVIKPGMDSKLVIARFEAERQALAMMDHMNIARVLDAGTTDGGRPYFIMELLKGTPITEFCDARRLTPRQRLELFIPVCQAIQHAHQKGIIHRDIKPSNVLVVLYDDKPVPKVIDFGVAKATGRALTEQTLYTGFSVIGTPEYMSPEQATLNQLDIDTRSDIYSLGVLLYELLTGTTPFKKQAFEKAGILEILRVIREEEPPRPSTKASTADTLPTLAAKRGIEPAKLCGLLRNDLDWIVMKTLEKDRSRRYETANGLIADISRYLAGEAVLAHPPNRFYRFGKFMRKNKGPMLAATLIFFALLAGVVGTTLGLLDAHTQRTLANTQRDRAVEAEKESKARADELQLVSDFQAGMLEQIDPNRAGLELSNDVKAKFDAALVRAGLSEAELSERVEEFMEQWTKVNAADVAGELIDQSILKPAVQAIEDRFKDQPLVAAQLRQSLANVYHELGLFATALELQELILKTRLELLGDEHPDTMRAQHILGTFQLSQGKLNEAETIVRESLEKRRRILGNRHRETLSSISNLGGLLLDQGKFNEAEPLLKEVMEASRTNLGEDDPTAITAISNFGLLLWSQGKLEEAESQFRDVLRKRSLLFGELHHDTLYSKVNLGGLLSSQSKHREAELLLRDALDKSLLLLGTEHPTTIACITSLGSALIFQGKPSEAEPLVREAFEKCPRVLGERHKTTIASLECMGLLLQDQGKPTEAEPILRDAVQKSREVLGDDHLHTILAIARLSSLLWSQGKVAEADKLTQESLERSRRVLGDEHSMTLDLLNDLASSYWSKNQLDKSIPIFEDLLKRHQPKFGREKVKTLDLIANLGVNYQDAGRSAEAIPLLKEVYTARRGTATNWIGHHLVQAYIAAGQLDNARNLVKELLDQARTRLPNGSLALAGELAGCGEGFLRLGDWAEAEQLLRESKKFSEAKQHDDWKYFYFTSMLGETLLAQSKFDEAQPLLLNGYKGLVERISTLLPVRQLNVKKCFERVIQLYKAADRHEEAAEWQRKLDTVSFDGKP